MALPAPCPSPVHTEHGAETGRGGWHCPSITALSPARPLRPPRGPAAVPAEGQERDRTPAVTPARAAEPDPPPGSSIPIPGMEQEDPPGAADRSAGSGSAIPGQAPHPGEQHPLPGPAFPPRGPSPEPPLPAAGLTGGCGRSEGDARRGTSALPRGDPDLVLKGGRRDGDVSGARSPAPPKPSLPGRPAPQRSVTPSQAPYLGKDSENQRRKPGLEHSPRASAPAGPGPGRNRPGG